MSDEMKLLLGPSCRECRRDEARCAKDGGCCMACTHTFDGEDSVNRGGRGSKCGTNSGYQRHRSNGYPACKECLAAHALAVRDSARRREQSA